MEVIVEPSQNERSAHTATTLEAMGGSLHERVRSSKVLVVGAGGIGCGKRTLSLSISVSIATTTIPQPPVGDGSSTQTLSEESSHPPDLELLKNLAMAGFGLRESKGNIHGRACKDRMSLNPA